MSKKKKLPKYIREHRRITEAQKASERFYTGDVSAHTGGATVASTPAAGLHNEVQPERELRFSLPVKEIKKDLIKNIVYLVFCISVLWGLSAMNITLGDMIRF